MSKPTFSTTYPATRPSTFAVTAKLGRAGISSTTVSYTVGASGDDGYWEEGMGFYGSAAYGQVGSDGMGMTTEHTWLRFQSVAVPQGSTISTATIALNINESATYTFDMELVGQDEDDSTAPSDAGDLDGASLTTATVAWEGDSTWAADDDVTTPEMSTIIEEIIGRGSWVSGNDLTIQLKYAGDGSQEERYRFTAYDGTAADAATLSITYT